jgi:hypothetical protein
VRELGEVRHRALRQRVGDAELEREVRRDRHDVGVARALAVAVHRPLNLQHPGVHRDERVRDRAPSIVVDVDPQRRARLVAHDLHDPRDVEGQHPAVRVAEHQPLGAGFLRRGDHRHRERGVTPIAVEEMLRIEEDAPPLCPEERDRVAHHRDAFVQVGPQRLGHVQIPRLADQADHLGAGVEQIAEHLGILGTLARPSGHPERRQLRVLERLLRREPEELGVARVRAGPPALDVGEPNLIEPVQDPQTVLDGVGEVRLLGAVTERRVVELDAHRAGVAHAVAPSTTRSPTSVVV